MIQHLPLFLQEKNMEIDVRHYFNAVDFSPLAEKNRLTWKYLLGSAIEKKTSALTMQNIGKLNVAIIGAPFDSRSKGNYSQQSPDKIREELYLLSKFDNKINIADFGNLKPASSLKGNYQALRDIVEIFNELKITTIIIGGSQDLSVGVCEAFKNNRLFSFSTIDSLLDIKKSKEAFNSKNYLSRVFASQPHLFQFSLLGFQSHYVATEYFAKTKGMSSHLRLGKLRDNMALAEPILRNSDVLSFDLGAIKYSEAPGRCSFSPNGLRSEEACQLAKYAGLSDRLKVFGLFEYKTEKDQYNLTAKLAAQIIWYFAEGVANRRNLKPDEDDQCITYRVEVKNIDNPLVFLKNATTNQWWMQITPRSNNPLYFACSESEYMQASNDEIPELWLSYIQKLDGLLK